MRIEYLGTFEVWEYVEAKRELERGMGKQAERALGSTHPEPVSPALAPADLVTLSQRQWSILGDWMGGMSGPQIARRQGVARTTVYYHQTRLIHRLGGGAMRRRETLRRGRPW
jgi:ATP/maltotriose-dependent transcriptional regulator MalT